jgi:hypothetical protein
LCRASGIWARFSCTRNGGEKRQGWSPTGESWYREDFGMSEVGYEKRLADPDP